MSVWKQVTQNLAGLGKHIVKTVASEPMEVVKDAVGEGIEKGQPAQQAADDPTGSTQGNDAAGAGFKTQDDFAKYQQLSGNRDQMELAILRKHLQSEWGLDTNLEHGMQRARQEYAQKEEERKKVEEHEEKQKREMVIMQKKQDEEALAVKAAREASSAENKAWGAG